MTATGHAHGAPPDRDYVPESLHSWHDAWERACLQVLGQAQYNLTRQLPEDHIGPKPYQASADILAAAHNKYFMTGG